MVFVNHVLLFLSTDSYPWCQIYLCVSDFSLWIHLSWKPAEIRHRGLCSKWIPPKNSLVVKNDHRRDFSFFFLSPITQHQVWDRQILNQCLSVEMSFCFNFSTFYGGWSWIENLSQTPTLMDPGFCLLSPSMLSLLIPTFTPQERLDAFRPQITFSICLSPLIHPFWPSRVSLCPHQFSYPLKGTF